MHGGPSPPSAHDRFPRTAMQSWEQTAGFSSLILLWSCFCLCYCYPCIGCYRYDALSHYPYHCTLQFCIRCMIMLTSTSYENNSRPNSIVHQPLMNDCKRCIRKTYSKQPVMLSAHLGDRFRSCKSVQTPDMGDYALSTAAGDFCFMWKDF